MNLLTDRWIPAREQAKASVQKLTLRQLLCEDGKRELCLPRDDMEMAALQLLICMTQALATPENLGELKQRIMKPLEAQQFDEGCQSYTNWFQLDNSKYPFMQVRGVKATEPTPMDKLLAGVTGATNSCFVNQPGLGESLCPALHSDRLVQSGNERSRLWRRIQSEFARQRSGDDPGSGRALAPDHLVECISQRGD